MFQYKLVRAFASNIISILVFVLYEIIRLFVDSVVCEVHAEIFQVGRRRIFIRNRCEARQAIFENINAQRRDPIDKHIESKVKFKPIDQIWLVHVSLDDHVFDHTRIRRMDRFLSRERFRVSRQENAFPLATSFGLDNERTVALTIDLAEELFEVLR